MSEPIGKFIDGNEDNTNRSVGDSETTSDGNTESTVRNSEPETINGFPTVNPLEYTGATFGGEPDTGTGTGTVTSIRTGRRGRPPGSKNKPREERDSSVISSIEDMLLGCHSMLAMWTSSPEMELDEKEAKELSNAIQRVSKFYTQTVDPKKLAWANLIFVAGGIYGTRYAAISNRKSKEKPARAPAPIPLKHPTVKEVNEEKNMPITNPSQLWPQSGGVDGEITEG